MPSIRRGKIAGENAVIWKEKKKNAVHNFAWNSILKLEGKGIIILEGWGLGEIRDIYLFFYRYYWIILKIRRFLKKM